MMYAYTKDFAFIVVVFMIYDEWLHNPSVGKSVKPEFCEYFQNWLGFGFYGV